MTYRDPKTGRWSVNPNQPTHYTVFVYGTLKKGYNNHRVLGPGAQFIGKATTCSHYRMIDVGFPVIVEDGDGHPVAGELYRVEPSALPNLDRLESEGSMYDRKVTECTLASGGPVECYIYVGCKRWEQYKHPWVKTNEDGELEWNRAYVEERREAAGVRTFRSGEQHD